MSDLASEIEAPSTEPGVPKSVYLVTALFISLIFATLGLSGNPELVSIVMWLLLAFYLVSSAISDDVKLRLLSVLAMASLHFGAIISYYSNPLLLPFVIIERNAGHSSINIDFVQAILVFEAARWLYEEKTKRGTLRIHEAGAGE